MVTRTYGRTDGRTDVRTDVRTLEIIVLDNVASMTTVTRGVIIGTSTFPSKWQDGRLYIYIIYIIIIIIIIIIYITIL